jgi:hypothetical protein
MIITAVFCSVAFRVALDRLSVRANQNFRKPPQRPRFCAHCDRCNSAVKAAHFASVPRACCVGLRCAHCVQCYAYGVCRMAYYALRVAGCGLRVGQEASARPALRAPRSKK